ncbi:hypothetical protein [Psychrobacillus psychrodurans]|uniref:DUF2178 domain-containing protein n=1 Tax=Psychrobacillus psychrodurans TaxID=126157 RepID=A0A9X3LB59_9BACI|nr:hypothetical protein [Psychrobacillus psychrodurans]MCZ8534787.1 hypothetical protein [Psychrobacillus psychrodurans]
MSKKEVVSLILMLIVTLYFGATLISYVVMPNAEFGVTEILLIIAIVVGWAQFFTWHARKDVKKDELGKKIVRESAYLSHQIVFGSLLLLWIIDFFFINKGQNFALFIALAISYITFPIVQSVHVKKYL